MEHAAWPSLPLASWEATYRTLHRFTQVVGKIRLALAPPINHWWHTTLYVTERGLTTSPMPYRGELVTMTLDLRDHRLLAECSDGNLESFALDAMSIAEFYARARRAARIEVDIVPAPVEVVDRTPFDRDTGPCEYDRGAVQRLHRILLSVEPVFQQYRGAFVGKSSPVHFFWGAFDLAVTRFSGRRNPAPPPGRVMGEAYSHEVISHGFWPGGDWPNGERVEEPMFYTYAVPEPAGFRDARVAPAEARYEAKFSEFFLPYEAVRTAHDPGAVLREFLDSSYAAAAALAGWPEELRGQRISLGRG